MKNAAILALKNFIQTLIFVAVCFLFGYFIGSEFGAQIAPGAAAYVSGRNVVVDSASLNRYYEVRHTTIAFCCWAGLIMSQVTFILQHFIGPRAGESQRAFPVSVLPRDEN